MARVKLGTKEAPESTWEGVRRMVHVDRRYAADVRALERYLAALERLIPSNEPPPRNTWRK